jgi:hypothetical protein
MMPPLVVAICKFASFALKIFLNFLLHFYDNVCWYKILLKAAVFSRISKAIANSRYLLKYQCKIVIRNGFRVLFMWKVAYSKIPELVSIFYKRIKQL